MDPTGYAQELLEQDLAGCYLLDGNNGRLSLDNGVVCGPEGTQLPSDRITLRTLTRVGSCVQSCEVTYELVPSWPKTGPDAGRFHLVRRARVADPRSHPPVYDEMPRYRDEVTEAEVTAIDWEVCHDVTGFNLEYLASDGTYSELEPSPFPDSDPLGDGAGANDGVTPYTVPAIRVTLEVEDPVSGKVRKVRRVFRIPAF